MIRFFASLKRTVAVLAALILLISSGANIAAQGYSKLQKDKTLKKNANKPINELFHDQGYIYMEPLEPSTEDEVTIRLRAERYNVTKAQIQYTLDSGKTWNTVDMRFEKVDETGYYDYWVGVIPPQKSIYYYRFIAENDSENSTVYLGPTRLSKLQLDIDENFCVIPGFSTPDWSKGIYWYSVNTDAFYNGDFLNDLSTTDIRRSLSWGLPVNGLHDRFGGDLKGIYEKIDYLKNLGIEAVYLNPIWKSAINVGYGISNYDEISPFFGNEQMLISLIQTLHENKMKIMLDAVFSYGALDGTWFNQKNRFPLAGAYQSKNSPYTDMFWFYQWPKNYKAAWGNAALNFSSPVVQNLIYKSDDSILQRYIREPYSIDAWRFDAVQYFWGTDTDQSKIAADIKRYLKSINPEVLLIREEYTDHLYEGNWDSSWGHRFLTAARDWYNNTNSAEELVSRLNNSNYRLPRPIALSMYNHYDQHDFNRLYNDTKEELVKINAVQILLMTYIGSPCLYYGDEVGVTNMTTDGEQAQNRNSFNWDESSWNYSVYNMQKALGQLRQDYNSTLKTGILKMGKADNAKQTVEFGRWDGKNTVITKLNKSNNTYTEDLDVKQYNVKDGQIVTDYLTGESYRVKDGKIENVRIIPGGTVLVTGKKAANYRGIFEIYDNNQSGSILRTDSNTFAVTGKGSINGKDKLYFAGAHAFNNFSLSAVVDGNAVLAVKDSASNNAAGYYVCIQNGNLSVYKRGAYGEKAEKLTDVAVSGKTAVRIVRMSGGELQAFTAPVSENSTGEWAKVENSSCRLNISENVLAGFAPLKGKAILSQVELKPLEKQYGEDFENNSLGSMFTTNADKKQYAVSNGKLTINPEGKTLYFLSGTPEGDFTFQAKLTAYKPQDEFGAGVIAHSSDDSYIIASRALRDNKPVFVLGRVIAGSLVVDSTLADTEPDKDAIIQLQKIGSYYSAVVSFDGKNYSLIGQKLFANYSVVKAGIFAKTNTAAFDFAGFGNAVNDGISTNTPRTPGNIDTEYAGFSKIVTYETTQIYNNKGKWQYTVGGIARTDTDGVSQMVIQNKTFENFRAEATLKILKGTGYVALRFHRTRVDEEIKGGYMLQLDSENTLKLLRDDTVLAQTSIKEIPDNGLRIILEYINGSINVYTGQEASLTMSVRDSAYSSGFFSYFTKDVSALVSNYYVCNLDTNWTDVLGVYTPAYLGASSNIVANSNSLSLANLQGVGLTDLAAKIYIKLNPAQAASSTSSAAEQPKAYAGIVVGASQGYVPKRQGIMISLNEDGRLSISQYGKELVGADLGKNVNEVTMLVTVKNQTYKVYINGSDKELLSYTSETLQGGVFSIVSENSLTKFSGLAVYDITHLEDPTSHTVFKEFLKSGPVYEEESFTESFDDYNSFSRKWLVINGSWNVKDGVLRAIDNTDKWSCTASLSGYYKNVEISYRLRFDGENDDGFAGMSFYKQGVRDSYVVSGYCVMVTNSGQVKLYNGKTGEYLKGEGPGYIENFDAGAKEWISMKVTAKNGVITIIANNKTVLTVKDSYFTEGFFSFHASESIFSIDDVSVRPVK